MNGEVRSSSHTVYVLGAGFSYGAKVPLQAKILERLRQLRLAIDTPEADFFERMPIELAVHFQDTWGKIQEFLDKIFSGVMNPSLEDVFTLLDQTIETRGYCLGMNWVDLEMVRTALYKAIVILFLDCKHTGGIDLLLYRHIALELMVQRLAARQSGRGVSVISVNWDCILEDAIYWCLEKLETKAIDIDYCCYSIPFEGTSRHTTSILQKAKNLYNLKVMKLHGSVNWLLCPNCNRLSVGLGATAEQLCEYTIGRRCLECSESWLSDEGTEVTGAILEPFIISPTFMKQFDNVHIQMVWHNAYMDLCRADKVVFIGYSLPEADYHLRTLLKRAIRVGTAIDVVLVDDDRAPDEPAFENIRHKYAASRYEAFFGTGEHIKYYFDGVEGYFAEMCDGVTLDDKLARIKAEHATVLDGFPL